MSSISTTRPKREKSTGVSSVMRPVTHTADTDVKNASSTATCRPSAAAIGSDRSRPPTAMMARKLDARNCDGDSGRRRGKGGF